MLRVFYYATFGQSNDILLPFQASVIFACFLRNYAGVLFSFSWIWISNLPKPLLTTSETRTCFLQAIVLKYSLVK
ncbi:hypothetical protein T4C_6308 [Trichinella pseudospiralis]|uniref:Uncharacterized protein n=1 Tax=Trichinella pseudospiralis TaxID=6337 RepID=A0A0V1GRV8_TRIPS|nr:hypothetical protein T4C_6308 [Trichinella pseudospiralis]